MLVASGSVRRGRTCIRAHAVAQPSDTQGVRGLIGPFRERLNWEDDWA
jgi:hypothetical protein